MAEKSRECSERNIQRWLVETGDCFVAFGE